MVNLKRLSLHLRFSSVILIESLLFGKREMRRTITTICLIGSILIILGQFNAFESFFIFLIAGVIPGTNYIVPYQAMLFLISTLVFFILFRVAASDAIKTIQNRIIKTTDSRKKHLPKRRYSQI
jgi:hypothetical protein